MNCYNCGATLNENDLCPNCGADVYLYKRIIKKSNTLYNEGLAKAKVRDLTGAAIALRESLRLYKKNTNARNLLGLIYFETGEVVSALSEWTICRFLDSSKDNLANLYIERVSSETARLNTIDETLKKYNQALQYCYQGSYDLAAIQLKKVLSINDKLIIGYQLLALIYIETEEFEKARRTLLKSLTIDGGNTRSLTYLKEVNSIIREIEAGQDGSINNKKRVAQGETTTYLSGTDTIIQPIYEKERSGFTGVINMIIGILVGLAICYFLILPARVEKKSQEYEEQVLEVSNQLSEEQAKHNQDAISLENITAERDALKKQVADLSGQSGKMRAVDYLIAAADAYISNEGESQSVMELLDNITEDDIAEQNEDFVAFYNKLKKNTGPKVVASYVEAARTAMKASDYEEAVKQYTKAYELDKTNSDVIMNLAHAYRQNGDIDKADELYKKIVVEFPETQNAIDAADYITNQ